MLTLELVIYSIAPRIHPEPGLYVEEARVQ